MVTSCMLIFVRRVRVAGTSTNDQRVSLATEPPLLVPHVAFVLNNLRHQLGGELRPKGLEVLDGEVTDPNGPCQAPLSDIEHSLPRIEQVPARRRVYQVQIHKAQLQPFELRLKCRRHPISTVPAATPNPW